jgi:uncharacterized protein (DUF427 family)
VVGCQRTFFSPSVLPSRPVRERELSSFTQIHHAQLLGARVYVMSDELKFSGAPTPVPRGVVPEETGEGQISVWTFPRPAEALKCPWRITIDLDGERICDTTEAFLAVETSHPPTYYVPRADLEMERFSSSERKTECEWKGTARYYNIQGKQGTMLANGAWYYGNPTQHFRCIEDHVAFYASKALHIEVDGEVVSAQPGGFYGGWVTKKFVGPFKGGQGSMFW